MPTKEGYQANKEYYKAKVREWREANKERYEAYNYAYKTANSEYYRAYWNASTRKRQTAKKGALPKWISTVQLKEIQQIYQLCPVGYQVDHIIPLQSKHVCGLHVPWNLQYLTRQENCRKGNRYEGQPNR